jgi:hypothetical protein
MRAVATTVAMVATNPPARAARDLRAEHWGGNGRRSPGGAVPHTLPPASAAGGGAQGAPSPSVGRTARATAHPPWPGRL